MDGTFKVIECQSEWNSILSNFKDTDVYYTYEYGRLFAEKEEGKLLSAYYENQSSRVFYPFILRKVDWESKSLYDIVTPYGYGGPLFEGMGDGIESFYRFFTDFCLSNQIITETIRFHPIKRNYELCKNIMDIDYIRKTTAVDLTLQLSEIRKQYSPMTKRNIIKAQNQGLNCFLAENNEANVHLFMEMYKETMDRNKADDFYYFSENYFIDQLKQTSHSETFLLLAQYDGQVIAGVMVLKGPRYAHYHLGASKMEFLYLRPNNMLFDFMIEFCKLKGCEILHLGGGYQENDGLFKFKSSFTGGHHYDYFIGKKVYDHQQYNKISEDVKQRHIVNAEYFPIYRGIKGKLITN